MFAIVVVNATRVNVGGKLFGLAKPEIFPDHGNDALKKCFGKRNRIRRATAYI